MPSPSSSPTMDRSASSTTGKSTSTGSSEACFTSPLGDFRGLSPLRLPGPPRFRRRARHLTSHGHSADTRALAIRGPLPDDGPPGVEHGMSVAEPIVLRDWIRDVPDFPKPGILFKDITPLLSRADVFGAVIDRLADRYAGDRSTRSPRRRPGASSSRPRWRCGWGPRSCRSASRASSPRRPLARYQLEYGSDRLEIHQDATRGGPSRALARRRPGHGGDHARLPRPRRASRRRGRRLCVRGGAGLPARTGEAGAVRGLQPGHVLKRSRVSGSERAAR